MGIGFYLTGRYGDEHRETDPEAWLTHVESWIEDHAGELLERVRIGRNEEGSPTVFASLHPCAEDLEIFVPEAGRVIAMGKTSTVGPGFHLAVCDLVRRFGEEWGIEWDEPDEETGTGDETGYFRSGDETAVQNEFLVWLRNVASIVAENLANGYQEMMVSMPIGHLYPHFGPLVTPLGPRDLDWLEAVAADPMRGIDVFPWWSKGFGAPYFLGRALSRMWKDVRWRMPLTESEQRLLLSVHRDLTRAYDRDPALAYPWREWDELIAHIKAFPGHVTLGRDDIEQAVIRNAAEVPVGRRIGYRRSQVQVDLTGGWSIKVPGAMAEEWDEDGTWSGWDGRRTVWFTSCTLTKHDGSKPSADEILEEASPPEGQSLEYRNEQVMGKGVFARYEEEGNSLWRLSGRSAVEGCLGLCNIIVEDETEQDWAESVWKSLNHA